MPTAAEAHDRMVAAYDEQRARVLGHRPDADVWSGRTAARFRDNPRRQLEPVLEKIASYLRPDDVLIDVGGGAGRLGLPLALRSKEVINVDPSPGMRALFDAIAAEAAITNARFIQADWVDAPAVEGDVALVAHVTYFVPDIRAFLTKVVKSTRRRVIVHTNSVPPPNTTSQMFELVNGEPQALVPTHVELMAVLEEMGVKPELTMLEATRDERAGPLAVIPDRKAAVEGALIGPWLRQGDEDRVRGVLEAHFEDLFSTVEGGYIRNLAQTAQPVLITWETR